MAKSAQFHPGGGPRSQSFLIRFWPEPRESAGGEEIWRGYLRDLRTGEEEYLTGPNQLVRLLTARIEQLGIDSKREERSEAVTAGRNSD